MEKIWIAGSKGHVGSALTTLLDCMRYELLPTDHNEVDITDREAVEQFVRVNRPDIIINCVGFGDVAACEKNPDKAFLINAVGARNLAVLAQSINAKLIHLSTDDVFAHKANKPYNEFDVPIPDTVYGQSKLAGEKFVQTLCPRHVIVRSSWVYGIGHDFLHTILDAANDKNCKSLKVSSAQYGCPTSATELAKTIEQFIDNDSLGIHHAVCQGSCSRYEYAKEILRIAHLEKQLEIIEMSDDDTYSVLDNMMLRLENLEQPTFWKDALSDYIESIGGIN